VRETNMLDPQIDSAGKGFPSHAAEDIYRSFLQGRCRHRSVVPEIHCVFEKGALKFLPANMLEACIHNQALDHGV